jgi:tripartite-type tricarboxylate transporter receptor subunit TctC
LNRAIQALLRTPEVRKEIADEGGAAGDMTPEEFTGFLRAERKRWQGLVVESGVSKVL